MVEILKTQTKGKKMKIYTIEIEAIRKLDVIAESKEEAFKKLKDYQYDYHSGHYEGCGDITSQWSYETGDFNNAKVVYEENY